MKKIRAAMGRKIMKIAVWFGPWHGVNYVGLNYTTKKEKK